MATIKHKRRLLADMPVLAEGELAVAIDPGAVAVYVGQASGVNLLVGPIPGGIDLGDTSGTLAGDRVEGPVAEAELANVVKCGAGTITFSIESR
jgi:hypothetical protein